MGLHQRIETGGLVSFLLCVVAGGLTMQVADGCIPVSWSVSMNFLVCAILIALCGTISFIVGYARRSRSFGARHAWTTVLRRVVEILALAIVYASTLFLVSFALLSAVSQLMGTMLLNYLPAICAGVAGIAGYMTYVQAELMDAKTLASLLLVFVISGVSVAGLTTDDPYWFENNFSQLGDRTTFAARMFNSTLILAGICVIIVTYFAISELVATYRQRREWHVDQGPYQSSRIRHYQLRLVILTAMLIISGASFIGIGIFRYTPHPTLHNLCAHGLTIVMVLLLVTLPWLAPQLSRAIYVASDLAVAVCAIALVQWMGGANTMTNVEALAGFVFLGWFIMFSRQIAAIEADRTLAQIAHSTSADGTPHKVRTGKKVSRLAATQ